MAQHLDDGVQRIIRRVFRFFQEVFNRLKRLFVVHIIGNVKIRCRSLGKAVAGIFKKPGLSFQVTSCITVTEFVVFPMGEDVLHIHGVVDELDKGNDSQVVAGDINDPLFGVRPPCTASNTKTPQPIQSVEMFCIS